MFFFLSFCFFCLKLSSIRFKGNTSCSKNVFVLDCPKLNWLSDELGVGAADLFFRCYDLKNCIGCKFLINIFQTKMMIHVHF